MTESVTDQEREMLDALTGSTPTDDEVDDDSSLEEAHEQAKEYFVDILKRARSGEQNRLRENIDGLNQNIRNYETRIRDYRWQLNDAEASMRTLESNNSDRVENFESEFDALLRHNKVHSVAVDPSGATNCVFIRTHEITMKHPHTDEEKVLGELEIKIPIQSSELGQLSVYNRTNAKEDTGSGQIWAHPHVENGRPCFGSFDQQIVEALSQGSINAAFEYMLMYLQTFNPEDSYGRHWNYWE